MKMISKISIKKTILKVTVLVSLGVLPYLVFFYEKRDYCEKASTRAIVTSFTHSNVGMIGIQASIEYEFSVNNRTYKGIEECSYGFVEDYEDIIGKEFEVKYCISNPEKSSLIIGTWEVKGTILSVDSIRVKCGVDVVLNYKLNFKDTVVFGKDTCSSRIVKVYGKGLIGHEFNVKYFMSDISSNKILIETNSGQKYISDIYYNRCGIIVNDSAFNVVGTNEKGRIKNDWDTTVLKITDPYFKKIMQHKENSEIKLTSSKINYHDYYLWLDHEFNVARYLYLEHQPKNIGKQILFEVCIEEQQDTLRCRMDYIIRLKNGKYRIVDIKSSRDYELNQYDASTLVSKFTIPDQRAIYKAIKNNKIKWAKPVGEMAEMFFLTKMKYSKIPKSIKLDTLIDIYINEGIKDGYKIYKMNY